MVAVHYKETLEVTKLPAYSCVREAKVDRKCQESSGFRQSLFTKQRHNFLPESPNQANQPGAAAQPPALTWRTPPLEQAKGWWQGYGGEHQEFGGRQQYFRVTAVKVANKGREGGII